MKLVDLHPIWVGHGGPGVTGPDGAPIPLRERVGIMLDCPCGKCDSETGGWLYVPFRNPIDGGPPVETGHPTWERTGDSFETLTVSPSILRSTERGGCGWHGWIRSGEVTSC